MNALRASLALAVALVALAAPAAARAADPRPPPGAADLGPKRSIAPDAALSGSIAAKGVAKAEAAAVPLLQYDAFRQKIEYQISDKRREEIASLQKLIQLGGSPEEMPGWYFRLAELLWEESQYFFFEAGRRDDALLALPKGDARIAQLQADKRGFEAQSAQLQDQAVALYKAIVARYPKYPRMDEVLFFLAENLSRKSRFDENAMRAYRALIERYPKSRFVPDSWMAFGEYYFERANKHDRIGNLKKALQAYQRAASYQDSSVYGYAMYKQAWVHYNLGEWNDALDLFRAVIYFGELPTSTIPADRKLALVREARKDYVRTYSHVGSPEGAIDEFKKVGGEKHWWEMSRTLAGLYFDEGKDREAIVLYHRLIQAQPLSPEAPLFQSRIVTSAGRMGKKEAAVQQAHVFVKMLRDITAAVKDDAGKKALDDARREAENTLRTLAVQYHNEWKKTRDEPVAGYAAAVYQDYLETFPDSKTAYEMRFFYAELLYALGDFERAGKQYEAVALEDVAAAQGKRVGDDGQKAKPGKFFKDALEDTVYAYDVVAKKLDETEKRAPSDPKKPLPMAPQRKQLLDACLRYLEWQPSGDKWVDIAYKAANIYYRHNDFAEATDLFTRIALDHPTDELAGYSTNLVLDAYNLLGDWRNVNGWAKRFWANAALLRAHPGLKDDLARIIEQSAFKIIEDYEHQGDYAAAAEAYLAFARDWPASKLAPTALYDASVDLAKAHQLDRAVRVRDQLIARFPADPLAAKCVYDNAEAYEAVADFDKSAEYYERYFHEWKRAKGGPAKPARGAHRPRRAHGKAPAAAPASAAASVYEEKKAYDAIINAAVFRAGLREFARAEADTEAYLETWPNGADAPRIFLSLADLYGKRGETRKELRQLEEYQKRYAKDPDEWMAIQQRIATTLDKSGDAAGARRAYDVGYAYWRRNQGKVKERGMGLVAEAMYRELEPLWAAYAKIGFDVPSKDLKYQLARKKKRLEEVQQRYAAVVKLKQAQPAVCALWRIAGASANFADSLLGAPVPKEIRRQKEYVEEYRTQLRQAAEPFENDAAQGAALALQAARDYGISGDCARKAEAILAKYKPDAVTGSVEVIPPIPVPAAVATPRGYGILAAIQPVPAPAKGPPPDPAALPPLRSAPAASGAAPAPDDAPPPRRRTAAPGGKAGSGEPDDEDLLP